MKVLYLSKALVVAAYRDKLNALAREADVVAVAPRRWGAHAAEPATPGAATLRLRRAWLHGRNHLHGYPGLGGLLDRERPDLVHVDEEPYSLVTFQAVRLCRARGIPALFFAWQNLDKSPPPPFGALRRSVFSSVAGGIAGTESAARVLREAGFTGPLAVVPQFGVDERTFHCDPRARCRGRRELGLEDSDFLVGFGGRLVPEKGVHLLVRAVATLPGVHLSLAGEGPERERLARLAREMGAADRIHFRGHLPSAVMPAWLAALDVLALASLATPRWSEQFGRILVEAMACSVPVVASRSGEMEQVVGDAGVLVPEGDEPALRAALERLAADPGARRRLADAGRERVLAHFTQTRIATETLCFYRQILAARP
ncbi:MAG TPA: glycosyltransferase family 4 protein [Longimicrobiaceae bacterium]|nr:glycosyltransferase family 4 protein [Longimicrobiaceae bacterium]